MPTCSFSGGQCPVLTVLPTPPASVVTVVYACGPGQAVAAGTAVTVSGTTTGSAIPTETTSVVNPPASASVLLSSLQTTISGMGLPADFANSLLSKIQSIQTAASTGATGAACNQLGAFSNEVQAQSGKNLTVVQANQLLAQLSTLRVAIGWN